MERLQKILAHGGISSRRAAEAIITSGRVRVNGRVVTELGAKADPRSDRIEVDGKRVVAEPPVYLVLHKPRGVVSTMSDPEGRPTVRELLVKAGGRVYPVGRLDFATSGVLLATNDGDFAEGLLHPRKEVPKTYVVKVHGKMKTEDLDKWRSGVRLEDGMTLAAEAKVVRFEGDKTWFELTIREGRNQQIRRMGEATGFPVMRLARIRFADIPIEGLRAGQWRHLTREELMALKKSYGVRAAIGAAIAEAEKPKPKHRGAPMHGERGRPAPRRGAAGRDARATGADADGRAPRPVRGRPSADVRGGRSGREGRPESSAGRPDKGRGGRDGTSRAPGGRGPNVNEPARADRAGPGGRGRERTKTEPAGAPTPRYGGGSPGRRGYEVTKDWGGGVKRGATGSDQAREPSADHGGRNGRTRTTGTAGGIGASEDAPRVKGRRR